MKIIRALFRLLTTLPYSPIILGAILLMGFSLIKGDVLFWGTPSLQFIPWQVQAWKSILGGSLPLWNPLNGMGAPLAANYQSAIYYPPNWLLFLFYWIGKAPALAWGYGLLAFIHILWSGLGMAKLLKEIGVTEEGQAVGGLAFSLGGYLVARMGFFSMIWAAAWYPWIILLVNRFAPVVLNGFKPAFSRRNFLLLIICLALLLLAGHAQLAWYGLLLAIFWLIVGGVRQGGFIQVLKVGAVFGCACLVAATIASIQLIPTLEYLLQSQRAASVPYEVAMTFSFWPVRLLAFLTPNLFGTPADGSYWGYASYWEDAIYIGILPLMGAGYALSRIISRSQQTKSESYRVLKFGLSGLIIVAIVLALGKFTPIFPFLYRNIPGFSMFQAPARYMVWAEFALAILAGIGVMQWKSEEVAGKRQLVLLMTIAAALMIAAGAAWIFLKDLPGSLLLSIGSCGFFLFGSALLLFWRPLIINKVRFWNWLICLWVIGDLLAASSQLIPWTKADFYQENNSEVQNIQTQLQGHRLYMPPADEYLLKFNRFFRFDDFRTIEDVSNIRSTLLPDINLLSGIAEVNNFDPLVPGRFSSWMNWIATLPQEHLNTVLALMDVRVSERYNPQLKSGIEYIKIENPARIRWYARGTYVDSVEEAQLAVADSLARGTLLDSEVILEKQPEIQSSGTNEQACGTSLNLLKDTPDTIQIRTTTTCDGWFFLADGWYPGWVAWVDGKESEIVRADILFQAVRLPKGEHLLRFEYRPISFQAGFGITLFGVICLLFIAIFRRYSKKQN